jgi:hypothetical protein
VFTNKRKAGSLLYAQYFSRLVVENTLGAYKTRGQLGNGSMPAVYFIVYIALFGGLTKLALDQHPSPWMGLLLFVVFIVGWFIVIGIAVKRSEGGKGAAEVIPRGIEDGLRLLRSWASYMLGLVFIAGLIYLLFGWPNQR